MTTLTAARGTAPDAVPDDRPAWEKPSPVPLTWIVVGSAFLAAAGVLYLITAVQQVSADALTINGATSFGRLRPAAAALAVWGGLGMAGTGVAMDLTRRLVRVPVQLEKLAAAAGAIVTLSTAGGVVAILAGYGTGRPGLEMPRPASVPLALGLLLAAVVVLRTLGKRADDEVHPALWHVSAAVVSAPVLLLLGTLPRLSGVNDEIVRVFSTSGIALLWLVSLGIGIALYVVPATCRTPLYSRQLALAGFWGLVAFAPFSAPARLLSGPAQEWYETIGSAATIALAVPALAIALNLWATYSRRTAHVHAPELNIALAGTGLLLLAGVLGLLDASRTAGDFLHLTVFEEGLRELVVFGVAGAFVLAGAYHCLPALTGNRLANARLASRSAWTLAGGVALVALGLTVAGYVQGVLWRQAVMAGGAPDWHVVTDSIRPLLWLRVLGEAGLALTWMVLFQQVFSTNAFGDPDEETP